MQKIKNFAILVFVMLAVVTLFRGFRISEDKLYDKCKNEVLEDSFYKLTVEFLREDFQSKEIVFDYFRLDEKAKLKTDNNETDKDAKRLKLNSYLRNISDDTGVGITGIIVRDDTIEFWGVETCSFSIIISNNIKSFLKKKYSKYKLFDNYTETLLNENPQAVFHLDGNTYLLINQLYP